MENQDLITDEAKKEEFEIKTIKHISIMQSNDVNDDNVYLSYMSNFTNPGNETIQICEDKGIHYEKTYVSIKNKAYEQNEIMVDKKLIDKTNTKVNNKKTRRINYLSLNDKKENLKMSICGKVLKQKKRTKKSNKTAYSMIPNEMLYKKFESERYEKSMLPPFRYLKPNNANNTMQYIPYEITKQEESHCNYNSNRNMLQYLDYNNLKYQNSILNNITNMQNQIEQTDFINDNEYYNAYTTADYLKQSENPYFHSSIKPVDFYKLGMENKIFGCSCNVCTNNIWKNMHTVEVFPKTNNAFQQTSNNNILSHIPSVASNNTWNTAGSFNYQSLQSIIKADYNFKRVFFSGFNTLNNMNNSEFNVIAKKNTSPLNNWNSHINHLPIQYNINRNIAIDAFVPSEPLPSPSLYSDNTSIQFNNYYNKDDLTNADMSMDQYKRRDNFNPSTISTFENLLSATNTHKLNSESTILSQNNTTINDNNMIYDIINFLPETNTASRPEEVPSYIYVKKMDKNWPSNI